MLTRVPQIAPSEITPAGVYFNRRTFLAGAVASAASASLPAGKPRHPRKARSATAQSAVFRHEPPNRLEEIAGYNNSTSSAPTRNPPAATHTRSGPDPGA